MQDTLTTGMERFSTYDNPLIAFQFMVIVALALFILWLLKYIFGDKKESIETMRELAKSLAVLTEVVRNGKE